MTDTDLRLRLREALADLAGYRFSTLSVDDIENFDSRFSVIIPDQETRGKVLVMLDAVCAVSQACRAQEEADQGWTRTLLRKHASAVKTSSGTPPG